MTCGMILMGPKIEKYSVRLGYGTGLEVMDIGKSTASQVMF